MSEHLQKQQTIGLEPLKTLNKVCHVGLVSTNIQLIIKLRKRGDFI